MRVYGLWPSPSPNPRPTPSPSPSLIGSIEILKYAICAVNIEQHSNVKILPKIRLK
jgi:hypothetical protein